MLGSNVLSSSQCLITELIGLSSKISCSHLSSLDPLLPLAEWLLLAGSGRLQMSSSGRKLIQHHLLTTQSKKRLLP
jgi:hypothetical protein